MDPAVIVSGGGTELCFDAESTEMLYSMHDDWSAKGLIVLQPPTMMDFGLTFLAIDLDGHRLRVYVPAKKE